MDNPEKRIGYWWKLSHDCPKCPEKDLAISKFYYDADGHYQIYFLCVKCATEYWWSHQAFALAKQAHDRDDFETFTKTPLIETAENKSGAD